MYETPPEKILFCFGIDQPLLDEIERTIPNLKLHLGLPTQKEIEEFTEDRKHTLIVLDDLMHRVAQSAEMELLFTQGCHHRNASIIYVCQNLFPKGPKSRTIALNTYYLVLMRNFRSGSQISHLGRQLFPGKSNALTQAYDDVMKNIYAYLLVDVSPMGDDRYRLRTAIFPDEDTIVYVPI